MISKEEQKLLRPDEEAYLQVCLECKSLDGDALRAAVQFLACRLAECREEQRDAEARHERRVRNIERSLRYFDILKEAAKQ